MKSNTNKNTYASKKPTAIPINFDGNVSIIEWSTILLRIPVIFNITLKSTDKTPNTIKKAIAS